MERSGKDSEAKRGASYAHLHKRQLDRRKKDKAKKPASSASSKSSKPGQQQQRTRERYSTDPDLFHYINERPVDEISLSFFYSPHTVTLLVCSVSFLVYVALTR